MMSKNYIYHISLVNFFVQDESEKSRAGISSVLKLFFQSHTPDIVAWIIKSEYPGEKKQL